jgi:predicted unusual protein kinase regulating ubiquinone biosynthesis (AarF/ABC1/UbiB family)
MMQTETFPVGRIRVLGRMLVWLFVGVTVNAGILFDWLRGRNSEAQRAIRLRRAFERYGGTFRKIGRLLAMRIDLLPWIYCVELSKIVDQMESFPVESAIQKIQEAIGKPLDEVFSQFDPESIVSTTVACIYQALTHDGKKVAVKVRRPGIGETFMADLKAIDWIFILFESLSILRPDYSRRFRREFREMILDELNFLLEARHQTLFRREAKKSGRNFFTAPRVFFNLSNREVIVQEFTAGMWLWELLAAVEQNDQEALARAESLNIDPKKVAQRLLWVNFWSIDEHLHFRADLYPDQVIIRKNSKLTFIDFNSVGALSQEKRIAVQQTMNSAWKRDPLEMAHESMVLLEPMPPIDTTNFTRDLEAVYWKFLYAFESKQLSWWERTSARLWIGFVTVAGDHNITLSMHVLRMIRSCLFYDAIAARLYPKINRLKEYRKFGDYRSSRARKRVEKRIRAQFRAGAEDRIYLQVEGIANTTQRLFRQAQRFLSKPVMKINAVLGKSVYSLAILFGLLGQVTIVTALSVALMMGLEWINTREIPYFAGGLTQAFSNHFYQLIILLLIIVNVRKMLFRMRDKDL